ncbi:MAG: response regulator [Ignavibacteriae bacterium]|nr:response regulator [Ignavibacteriota bacterium]
MKRVALKQSPRLGLMVGTFVVPLVVFALGVVWQFTKAMEQEMLAHAEEKAGMSCEVLASSVGMGLSEGSFELVQKSYDLVRRDSNFTYIGIFDDQDIPLIEHNPAFIAATPLGIDITVPFVERRDREIRAEAVAQYQGVVYGRVSMVYSLERLREKASSLRTFTLIVGLIVFAIGLYGVYLLRRQDQALRHTAEDLSKSERFLEDIVNSAPVVLLAKDVRNDNRIVLWNKMCEEVFQATAEQMLGRHLSEILPDGEARAIKESDAQVIATRSIVEVQEQTISPSLGPQRLLRTKKLPLFDGRGVITHILTIGQDIASQKQWELDVMRAMESAEAASRAKGEFLANMSHEIRTPMNGIIGMTDLALRTELTDRQRKYLNAVKTSADSLLVVVNDVLDFSKIEAGKLILEMTPFDLRETVGDVVKTMAPQARKKHLELLLDIANAVPRVVEGDPTRLSQILTNLINNALKFTEEGEIIVRLKLGSLKGNTAVLRFDVEDTGIGIPKEKISSVFESFTQADLSTTRKYGGTGLGLSITARLLDLMGGSIQVESDPGRGTNFSFTVTLGVIEGHSGFLPTGVERLEGMRVVVIDDNRTNRYLVCDSLTYWGMKPKPLDHPWDLQDVLAKADQTLLPYQVVIVDSKMPETSGGDLIRAISTVALKTRPKFIMLSQEMQDADASDDPLSWPDIVLEKPVKQSELFDAIVTVLDKDQSMTVRKTSGDAIKPAEQPLRVLLAEDHIVNQELAMGILELAGHITTLARNGKEAVDMLSWQEFDVVLMDVQMPEMDGFQATAIIRDREKETGDHIPIIAMTAHAMSGYKEKCLDAGMDDYLSKPVRANQLLEFLSRLGPRTITPVPPRQPVAAAAALDQPSPDVPHFHGAVFDGPEALRQCLDNTDLLRRVVQSFVESLPAVKKDIRDALAAGDAPVLAKAAHTLKGATGSIVAQRSSLASLAIEQAAKAGDLAAAAAGWASLSAELVQLEEAIPAFLAALPEAEAARPIMKLKHRRTTHEH